MESRIEFEETEGGHFLCVFLCTTAEGTIVSSIDMND